MITLFGKNSGSSGVGVGVGGGRDKYTNAPNNIVSLHLPDKSNNFSYSDDGPVALFESKV